MNREKEILAVMEKYKTFFDECHADVAIGVRGPNFFYVVDDQYGELDEFAAFETAQELEAIILDYTAGEMIAYEYARTENLQKVLDYDHVAQFYGNTLPDGSLETLMMTLSAKADENAKWAERIGKIYKYMASAMGADTEKNM
ncbi:MAG: hypothetical protein LUC91_04985 [Prevotella sp.]|nr:hypothetical protein [Prevotella sp.]